MGMPPRQVPHGSMARTGMPLYPAQTTKTLHRMHLRVVGVMGRTVKSTADRQCHHEVAILREDADLVEGLILEVDSVVVLEGVGTQLQHRFRHEILVVRFTFY